MAATRLEAFLSKYDRNWDKYSPELRDETLRKYSDPLALEQYLFETAPDFYQIEQSSPGYTRQLAGSLTGGESVGAQILAAPKQATAGAVQGVGGLFGLDSLYEAGKAAAVESTPAYGSETGRFAGGLLQSTAQNLGALGVATLAAPVLGLNPVTAIPAISMGIQAGIKAGQNIGEYRERRPGDTTGAALYGLGGAATEVLGELAPIGALSSVLRSPTTGGVINYMLKEGGGEALTEIGDIGLETTANLPIDTAREPEKAVGDITTPWGERIGKATAAGVLTAGPTGVVAAKVINPRIVTAQKLYDERQVTAETSLLDTLVQTGEAQEITPAQATTPAESLQGTPESLAEANLYADELFNNYPAGMVEAALTRRQQTVTPVEPTTPAVEPVEPAAPTTAPAAAPTVLKPSEDLKTQAFRAATIYEAAQTGDEGALAAWAELPNNLKNAVPHILSAERAGQRPGKKAARALLGTETAGADDVSFDSSTRRINSKAAAARPPVDEGLGFVRNYAPGDKVAIKAAYKMRPSKRSATLSMNQIPDVTVLEQLEDGRVRVSIPAKNDMGYEEATIAASDIVPRAMEDVAGLDVKLGPTSPDNYTVVTVTKQLMNEFSEYARIYREKTGKALGRVTIRGNNGRAVKMDLDYALNRVPHLFEKTAAHEIGHLVSMVQRSTSVPGMDQHLTKKGSLLGQLVGEWYPLEQAIRSTPFEMGKGKNTEAIYEELRQFEEQVYDQSSGELDYQGMRLIQNKWNELMEKHGGVVELTDEDQVEIKAEAGRLARLAGRVGDTAAFTDQAKATVLQRKGAVPGYLLRREMENVVMKMRGVKPSKANRDSLRELDFREIYADFFAAKFLDLYHMNPDTGKWVPLAQDVAPTASRIFDDYLERKPKAREVFQAVRGVRTDAESIVNDLVKRQAETEERYAKRLAAENPEAAMFMDGLTQKYGWRLMQQLVDRNFAAYQVARQTGGYETEDQLRESLEQLANISSLSTNFLRDSGKLFNNAIQTIRENAPSRAREAEDLMGVYIMNKRIAEGGRQAKITQKVKNLETGEDIDINQAFDLFSGSFGGVTQAERLLSEHPVFSDPKIEPVLDNALKQFHELWVKEVLKPVADSGLISQKEFGALSKNVYYATYAIERELIGSAGGSFKAVTSAIKAQTGTLQDARNPLGATLEKGISLKYQAALNNAKRDLIASLPEKFKQSVKKIGNVFPQPVDRTNWALVNYKVNGEDVGYHVPRLLADGIVNEDQNIIQGQTLRALTESSVFFRNLYTTWNPAFAGKNPLKDMFRMVARSIDPTSSTGLGLGVLPQWAKVIKDLAMSRMGDSTATDRLNAEERELYNRALILSDFDWNARDASTTSAYQQLMRLYFLEYRSVGDQFEKASPVAQLLGKFISQKGADFLLGLPRAYTSRMESFGRGAEKLAKRAAYRYYSNNRGTLSEPEFNQLIRKAGSPYFLNRGAAHPLTSNLFLFFNPTMQGLYEDLGMMRRRPVVAGKWALGTSMKLAFMNSAMQWLAGFGGLGEEFKRWWRGVPDEDKDTGIPIPIGVDAAGKSVYWHIPLDETTSLLSKVGRRVLEGSMTGAVGEIFKQAEPNPHPLFKALFDSSLMFMGINPMNYNGKDMIPPTEWDAGGKYRWSVFAKNLYNAWSPIMPFYRFPRISAEDLDMARDKGTGPIAQMISDTLGVPFAQALMRFGLFKVSNQGIYQERDRVLAPIKEASARASIALREGASGALAGDMDAVRKMTNALTDLTGQGAGQSLAVSAALDNLPRKLQAIVMGGTADANMVEFMNMSDAEKLHAVQQGWLEYLNEEYAK